MDDSPLGCVFNIQKYSLYDGPGIRTLVFLKGCPLHCVWCSNPESIDPRTEIMFMSGLCTGCGTCQRVCPKGIHSIIPDEGGFEHVIDRGIGCTGCGGCESGCPASALSVCGKPMSVDDVMRLVMQDEMFYRTSGGGLTIGGGEVAMQTDFAVALLSRCREEGVSTAIETCGQTSWANMSRFLPVTDLFLYDMKALYPSVHKAITGHTNETILDNMRGLLDNGANLIMRMPIVKGYNDDRGMLLDTVSFVKSLGNKPAGIDILPYHKLGVGKYVEIGHAYGVEGDPSLDDAEIEEARAILETSNIPVRVIRH